MRDVTPPRSGRRRKGLRRAVREVSASKACRRGARRRRRRAARCAQRPTASRARRATRGPLGEGGRIGLALSPGPKNSQCAVALVAPRPEIPRGAGSSGAPPHDHDAAQGNALPRCPRHGCALLRVEHHADFALVRERRIFTCGWDAWVGAGDFVPRPVAQRRCTACGADDLSRGHAKCDRCRRCAACYPSGAHAIADCPRRRRGA